ncbi:MAG: efflux RND transporter periplasmic adaptor subunit [Rudaea sp.]
MKRRSFLVLALAAILITAGGLFYYQQQQASRVQAASANRATATITRGSIVASVSGAGNIYAPQQTTLNFESSGSTITAINVQVGDKVKAGQVLAQEDDTDLQYSLQTAQAQLTSAQAALAKLKLPPSQTDVTAAQAQVASAKSAYDAAVAKNNHAPDQLMAAKATLDKAQASLQQAQAAYDAVAWRDGASTSSQAADLAAATADYQAAIANYNLSVVGINDSAVKSAAQALASAQANFASVTAPATAQEIAQSQASVDSAQVAVDQARLKLNQAKIVAPFDGTIAAVNYVPGQVSGSTAVMSLVNLDNLETQITVAEVDIAKVKVGQQVELSLDALSGQTVTGKVVSVSPVGTVTSGVVNYTVTVSLTKSEPAIMPGMTTTAAVVVDKVDNVLLVPNKAVKTQNGKKTITLLLEGKETPLVVKTGLSNDQSIEIVSAATATGQPVNLADGDVVVLNSTTTSTRTGSTGGPGGPGGGLGIPGF